MNLTFEDQLIRQHPPEPLEGHTVVVLERVGGSGERFHSVLEPGAERPRRRLKEFLPGRRNYFAFAVDASFSRSLSFSELVRMGEREHDFELHFSLWYRVADPQVLVATRFSDPLLRVREKVAEVVTHEIAELPWADVWQSFRVSSDAVVATTIVKLRAFARAYGIAINMLNLRASFPSSTIETDRQIGKKRETVSQNLQVGVVHASQIIIAGTGNHKLYPVWYGTNRRPAYDESSSKVHYGARLDDRVHVGRCDVLIPASHKIGALGSPWIRRVLSGIDDRLRLQDIVPMETESY